MKLRINEGSQNKPFILTSDELSKLLQSSQEVTLEGYYNMAEGTLQNADYQRFKRKFPDANMLASVIPDGEWSVSLLNTDLSEGNSTKLQVVGANLIDLSVSIYSVSNSESSITENQIKSLIKIEGDTIRTSLLNVNKDNVATVVIRVQKSYDSSDFKDVILSIRQVAMTFTIEGINNEEVVEGSSDDLYNLYPLGNYGPDTAHVLTIRTNKNNTKEPLAQFNTTCIYGQVSAVNNKRFTYYVKNTDADDTIVVGLKLQTDVIQTQIQATVYCTNVCIEGLKGSNLLIDFGTVIRNYQYVSTGIEKYDEQIKETNELFFLESNGKTVTFTFGRTSSVITLDFTLATKQLRDFVVYDDEQKVTGFGLPNITVTYNGISADNNITNRFIIYNVTDGGCSLATFGNISIIKDEGGGKTKIKRGNETVYTGSGSIVFFEIESTNSGFKISDYKKKNILYETSEEIQGTFEYGHPFSWKQTFNNTETLVIAGSTLYHAIKASFKISNKYSTITFEKEDTNINFNPRSKITSWLLIYNKAVHIGKPKVECSNELLTAVVSDNNPRFYQLGFIEEKELHVKLYFGDGKPFPVYEGVIKTLQVSYVNRKIESQGKVSFGRSVVANNYLIKPSSKFEFLIEGSLVSDAMISGKVSAKIITFDYKKFNPFDKGKFREIIQYEKGDKVYETDEFNLELGFSSPQTDPIVLIPFINHRPTTNEDYILTVPDLFLQRFKAQPIVVCGANSPYPNKNFILTESNEEALMALVNNNVAELWVNVTMPCHWDYMGSLLIANTAKNAVWDQLEFCFNLSSRRVDPTITSKGNISYNSEFSMRMNAMFVLLLKYLYSRIPQTIIEPWNQSLLLQGQIQMFSRVDGNIAVFGKPYINLEIYSVGSLFRDPDGSVISQASNVFVEPVSDNNGNVRIGLGDSTRYKMQLMASPSYRYFDAKFSGSTYNSSSTHLPFYVAHIDGEQYTG